MSRVHLVLLWHMHQPQYRDPATKRYILPWTRLHALKDYWGMVRTLAEFPGVHATFNIVPSLAQQIEEYASGNFDDPWFRAAFNPATELTGNDKREILHRAFQVNHEHLMSRWPRFVELFEWAQKSGVHAAVQFHTRDWRDLQVLSQLAWMDEEYLARDPIVSALARRGADYTEADKDALNAKQDELMSRVLPEYRAAAERGQIEISTTPFYHPILPLLCDSQIARVANPHTPALVPPFRFSEDAREQLVRARQYHQNVFGHSPAGLWPSEGSVSDEVLDIAAELGFRWFATDEGILGRTRNIGFWRDGAGFPENAHELYSPWKFRIRGREIHGFFRDHYLSDLVGFVYSRMDAAAAADDFHRRLRLIGERMGGGKPATVAVILDGENAWEYYPGNGREFLRQLYGRIQNDPEIRALTATEAIAEAGEVGTLEGIFPGSWIDANFNIWIGDAEDIRAWQLLRDARELYATVQAGGEQSGADAPAAPDLATAYEALLAAEGSDWCWWYGPEHGSANDQEFDELYRKHLVQVYSALRREAPEALAHPIKRVLLRSRPVPPTDWLKVEVDGRVTSYFEWLGAGYYAAARQDGTMHGQIYSIGEIFYGFSSDEFYLRVDALREPFEQFGDCEFRFVIEDQSEMKILARLQNGKVASVFAERKGIVLEDVAQRITVVVGKIIEVGVAKELLLLTGQRTLRFSVSLWRNGLPVDVLPPQGFIEIALGEDSYAWPPQ
ncbi:MAG TPA: glycoside hydrolase family 57 protein [Candidatus Acidoferrales bacterium]|nr:glycoside hydrolase family 57 protein [Candidatus Acidoferrales bacterium]